MSEQFIPATGLGNCHLQTLFPRFHRPAPWIQTQVQWFDTDDGDRLAVHTPKPLFDSTRHPLVILLHGLEGSVASSYIQGMMQALQQREFQVAVMHFRGCGGIPNRLPRAYHSGDSEDPRWLAQQLRQRMPNTPLLAVGYSLGGNVLLKWLAEDGERSPLQAAAAVSPPMDLHACSRRINTGLSRVYQRHLLQSLRKSLQHKGQDPHLRAALPDLADPKLFSNFRRFDDVFTAPLHGFQGVDDYYNRASSKPLLKKIRRPTLIIHAEDDPFICSSAIPAQPEVSDTVELAISRHGGHVGFIAGSLWQPRYWLEERIPKYLLLRQGAS
ncbi:hypothetical protein Maes01_00123 [Microbulbifer aestuariivivens]|uniref:AB hydrolase-1 domain-containing protein n=1 Tax=Microbulbifer aestuariivivens TaxID=1908308 RepID=A0ABP9WKF2_9GAMM